VGKPDFLVLLSAAVFTLLSNTLSALENDVLQAMNPARSNPRLGLPSPEVGGAQSGQLLRRRSSLFSGPADSWTPYSGGCRDYIRI